MVRRRHDLQKRARNERSVQEMDDNRIIIKTKTTLALCAWQQGLLICRSALSFLQVELGCRMGQTEGPTA